MQKILIKFSSGGQQHVKPNAREKYELGFSVNILSDSTVLSKYVQHGANRCHQMRYLLALVITDVVYGNYWRQFIIPSIHFCYYIKYREAGLTRGSYKKINAMKITISWCIRFCSW
jgi:hypothetical protein